MSGLEPMPPAAYTDEEQGEQIEAMRHKLNQVIDALERAQAESALVAAMLVLRDSGHATESELEALARIAGRYLAERFDFEGLEDG